MAYQKVTTTSYGSRLKNSLGGVGMGFLMIIAGIVLLFWNEGRTVKTTRMLKGAQKEYVELGDVAQLHSDLDGKLVHATGLATTDEVLRDNYFGVGANAIKLARKVEYFQWVEHQSSQTRDKVGGGQETVTSYTYSKEWTGSPVNSSTFEDPEYKGISNTVLLQLDDENIQAQNVRFGAYRFPEGLVGQMNKRVPLNVELDPEFAAYMEKQMHSNWDVAESESFVHPSNNVIYVGLDPNNPRVGDVRVTFEKVNPGEVSILANVIGDTFEKYTAKNGKTLLALTDGSVSADSMFESEHKSNKMMAWVLRLLGILLIYLGFKNIFDILVTLLKVLPFLSNIANMGVNLVCGVLAFVIGLVVIAIAWIVYRPVLGIILLAAAGALIFFLAKKNKEKAAAAPAEPELPAEPGNPAQ